MSEDRDWLGSSRLLNDVVGVELRSLTHLGKSWDGHLRTAVEIKVKDALKVAAELSPLLQRSDRSAQTTILALASEDLVRHIKPKAATAPRWGDTVDKHLTPHWTVLLTAFIKLGADLHKCSECANDCKSMKTALFATCDSVAHSQLHKSPFAMTLSVCSKLLRHYGGKQSRRWLYVLSEMLAVSTGLHSFAHPLVDACFVRDAADVDVDTDAPAIVSILVDDSSEPVQCGMASMLMKNKEFAVKMVSVSQYSDSDTFAREMCVEEITNEIPAMGMRPFALYSRSGERLTDDTQKQVLQSLLYEDSGTKWNSSFEMDAFRFESDATRRLHLFAALSIYKCARIRTYEIISDACESGDSPLFSDLQLVVVGFLIGDDSSFIPSKALKGFEFRFRFLQLIGDRKTDFVEFEPLLEDWLQRIFADVCLDYDCGDVAVASALENDAFVRYLRTDAKRYTALLRFVLKCLRHTGSNPHSAHANHCHFVTFVRYAIDAVICSDAYDAKQFCALLNALLSKHEFYSRMALKCLLHFPLGGVALAVKRDYARGGKTALMNAIEFRVDDDVFERIVQLSADHLNVKDTLGLSALDYTLAGSKREQMLQQMGAESMACIRLAELREAGEGGDDFLSVKHEKESLFSKLARCKLKFPTPALRPVGHLQRGTDGRWEVLWFCKNKLRSAREINGCEEKREEIVMRKTTVKEDGGDAVGSRRMVEASGHKEAIEHPFKSLTAPILPISQRVEAAETHPIEASHCCAVL